LRLAVWSPWPPAASGVADYVAESLPDLSRGAELTLVSDTPELVDPGIRALGRVVRPEEVPPVDLHVYHLGNSPAHAFAYRAAIRNPGVVVLHEWSLHHLVLRETVERGDRPAYLREMRRAHGELGTFVGRQVARGLGGTVLPALLALNDRVLETSLAVVGLTRFVADQAARRLPGRPVLHLPHHLSLPDPLPTRAEARRALGLPQDALVVTAPGLATRAKRIDVALAAVAGLRARFPELRLVVAGAVEPELPLAVLAHDAGAADALVVTGRLAFDDFIRHLCAADVVLSLRFPSHGEMSGALVRALGAGRPVLVSAGTAAADEFPAGVVVPVDPGPREGQEVAALLARLLEDAPLRETIGRLAEAHVRRHHDLSQTTASLLAFLQDVASRQDALRAALEADTTPAGVVGYLAEEIRWAARDLGLPGLHLGLRPLVHELAGGAGGAR
jgi:glycosyltransferase involved in cell wall biosynthesis